MKPSSAKQKGRALQQRIALDLFERVYLRHGLEPDDIKSTSMGVSGVDIQLSPAAKRVLDLAVECKNVEALNVPTVFWGHHAKYSMTKALPILVSKRNRTEPLVTLTWSDFLNLMEKLYGAT